jgi:hypothetical protein
MTGKHYNWHKAWALDATQALATHDSGWRVSYTPEVARPADAPPPAIGGLCWTRDGRRYVVSYTGTDADLQSWLANQASRGLRDKKSIEARVARLIREAGDLWVHHLERHT